jgi:hypothetical protein
MLFVRIMIVTVIVAVALIVIFGNGDYSTLDKMWNYTNPYSVRYRHPGQVFLGIISLLLMAIIIIFFKKR